MAGRSKYSELPGIVSIFLRTILIISPFIGKYTHANSSVRFLLKYLYVLLNI